MSHKQQKEFISIVKKIFPDFFQDKTILEIGSLNINDSIRQFFSNNCNFTGVDLEKGKDVDIAIPGQLIDLPSQSFDITISCECFEHNPFWLETFINMLRLTKPGGLVIITCACYGRPEHGTSLSSPGASPFTVNQKSDYYCNLSSYDFSKRLDLSNWFSTYQFYYNHISKDIYFIGIIKNPEKSPKYHREFNAIAEYYRTLNNILYERLCFFGRDLVQNMRLYWLTNPRWHLKMKLSNFKQRMSSQK